MNFHTESDYILCVPSETIVSLIPLYYSIIIISLNKM